MKNLLYQNQTPKYSTKTNQRTLKSSPTLQTQPSNFSAVLPTQSQNDPKATRCTKAKKCTYPAYTNNLHQKQRGTHRKVAAGRAPAAKWQPSPGTASLFHYSGIGEPSCPQPSRFPERGSLLESSWKPMATRSLIQGSRAVPHRRRWDCAHFNSLYVLSEKEFGCVFVWGCECVCVGVWVCSRVGAFSFSLH